MDLNFTPEEEEFRLKVRRFLEENVPKAGLRAGAEGKPVVSLRLPVLKSGCTAGPVFCKIYFCARAHRASAFAGLIAQLVRAPH